MIKLKRIITPACLNPTKTKTLVEKFKASKEPVWHIDDLKWALKLSSNGKCAYCECKIDEESKYLEVEHFKDKDTYPDDVITWSNLLPSCKRCNVKKGTHDVCNEPIINPYDIDPRAHLGLRLYRIRPLTKLGETTIDLNNYERILKKRFQVGEMLHGSIDTAKEKLASYIAKPSTRTKNRLTSQIHAILSECIAEREYAATAATIVANDPDYIDIKNTMRLSGLWDSELDELEAEMASLYLKCV